MEQLSEQLKQKYKLLFLQNQTNLKPEQIAELQLKVKELEHDNECLKDQNHKNTNQLNKEQNKRKEVEEKNRKLEGELKQLNMEYEQSIIERDKAIGEKYLLVSQLQDLQQQFSNMQNINEVQSTEELESSILAFKKQYQALESKFVEVKIESNALKIQIMDLQEEQQNDHQKIQEQKETINGLRETYENLLKKHSKVGSESIRESHYFQTSFSQQNSQRLQQNIFQPVSPSQMNDSEASQQSQNIFDTKQILYSNQRQEGDTERTNQDLPSLIQNALLISPANKQISALRISRYFGEK